MGKTSYLLNVDAELWRRFKVKATIDNVSMRSIIEDAIRKYVGEDTNVQEKRQRKPFPVGVISSEY